MQRFVVPHSVLQAGLRRGKGDLSGAAELLKEYLQVSGGTACSRFAAFSPLLASSAACRLQRASTTSRGRINAKLLPGCW
jgi:hypothetical protein